jgi:O-antigen ligase/tetratricopeptide (TPR) repeat protein
MSTILKKKEKFLKNICFFIVYLVPLTLLFYGGTIYPYVIPKALAFIFLIDLLVIFYSLLVKLNPEYRPRLQSPVLWAIIIYLAALLLTSIFGQNLSKSLYGSLEYADGLLCLFHSLVFIIILLAILREKKQWLILLEISVFFSFLVSLKGLQETLIIYQSLGGWIRAESFFGNPLYFAHFLLFNIFFAIFLLHQFISNLLITKSQTFKKFLLTLFSWRNWRFYYYLLVIILELFLIVTTQTRGGFLGVVFGILTIVIISLIVYSRGILRTILGSLIIISLILIIVAMINLVDWQFLQKGPFKKLTDFSFSIESSIFRRLLIWQAGFESLFQFWLFGWGWANFDYAYLTHFPAQLLEDEGAAFWFKHAHNIIIEHLVSGGLLGIAAYLFLLVIILISWLKVFNQRVIPRFSLIVIIGLISADFVFNLFAFYTISSYILFFITLGLLIFLEQSRKQMPSGKRAILSKSFIFGSLILVIISLLFYLEPTFYVSKQLQRAINLEKKEKMVEAKEIYQSVAEKKGLTQTEALLAFNRFVIKWAKNFNKEELNLYEKAIQLTEPLVRTQPYNLPLASELLFLYKATFPFGDKYLSEAQDLAIKIKTLFPTHPLVYYHLGSIYLAQKNPALALEQFQQSINLDPKISQSYWLALRPAIILGKLDLVDQYLAKIENIEHPDPLGNPAGYTSSISSRPKRMRELAETFTQVGLYGRAIKTLEDLLHLEEIFALPFYKVKSQKIETLAQLAPLYAVLGQNEKAKEIAHQLLLLDSNLEEQIDNFLKELESGSLRKVPLKK